MRFISVRRRFHWSTEVTLVPSFITITSGNSLWMGKSFTPGSVPIAVGIGGTGISPGSGPAGEAGAVWIWAAWVDSAITATVATIDKT